jgi:hypothetical protein
LSLDVLYKIKLLRSHFIDTVDEMEKKYQEALLEHRREREVLLDIIRMEQKHSQKQENLKRSLVTFGNRRMSSGREINTAFFGGVMSENADLMKEMEKESSGEEDRKEIDDGSMSIQIDSIDENAAMYNYEINMKEKTIQNLHNKLVELTAQLKLEQDHSKDLQKTLNTMKENRSAILSNNEIIKKHFEQKFPVKIIEKVEESDTESTSARTQLEILKEELKLAKAVNKNLSSKLIETIERTSFMLTSIQNFENKIKDNMDTLLQYVEDKFSSYVRSTIYSVGNLFNRSN